MGPGLFTGSLIACGGLFPTMVAGLMLQAASLIVALMSEGVLSNYTTLILLGIGWNFAFVAGTMILLASITAQEKTKVTAVNETLRFACNAVAALISSSFTWATLNWICLGMIVL